MPLELFVLPGHFSGLRAPERQSPLCVFNRDSARIKSSFSLACAQYLGGTDIHLYARRPLVLGLAETSRKGLSEAREEHRLRAELQP